MEQGRFPQVLLFAGPKGTGKTSASRIIGNLLNDPKNADAVDAVFFGKTSAKKTAFQEPATDSEFAERVYNGTSFVVQEMDAASYRGIDDVRALKDRVMLPPQEGKIAVYILDEVHMFTTEAFNALLKVLEEPPAHAVFILATTELHKIPETIVSRSTKVEFRKATHEELKAVLEKIVKKEKITAEDSALDRIAELADGSFRDAVKLLELSAQSGEVSLATVDAVVGESGRALVQKLIEAVVAKEATAVSRVVAELRAQNVHEGYFHKQLFTVLHDALLQSLAVKEGEPVVAEKIARFLLQELLKADLHQPAPVPFLPLELKLLEIIERARQQQGGGSSDASPRPPAKKKIIKPAEPAPVAPVLDAVPDVNQEDIQQYSQTLVDQWEQFLKAVQQRNATVAALLRSSKPALGADGAPQLGVYYKFHQEQLQQRKYMRLLQDCAKDIVGVSLPLQVLLESPPQGASLVEVPEATATLTELAEETLLGN